MVTTYADRVGNHHKSVNKEKKKNMPKRLSNKEKVEVKRNKLLRKKRVLVRIIIIHKTRGTIDSEIIILKIKE